LSATALRCGSVGRFGPTRVFGPGRWGSWGRVCRAAWGRWPRRSGGGRGRSGPAWGRWPRGRGELGRPGPVGRRRLSRPGRCGVTALDRSCEAALAVVAQLLVDGPVREGEDQDHHQVHERDDQQDREPARIACLGKHLQSGDDPDNAGKEQDQDSASTTGPVCSGEKFHARPPLRGHSPDRSVRASYPPWPSVDRAQTDGVDTGFDTTRPVHAAMLNLQRGGRCWGSSLRCLILWP